MKPKLILLDADGVLWRGGDVIAEAPLFIESAQAAGIRCCLISNNAGPNRAEYTAKCSNLGLPLCAEDIFSVNHLAGLYFARYHPGKSVFVLGSRQLVEAMQQSCTAVGATAWLELHGAASREHNLDDLKLGFELEFDAVFVGIDLNVSYLKLAIAANLIQRGALLVGANPDISFPYENHVVMPGNGSIVQLLVNVTGAAAEFVGKPEIHMLELIEEETGVSRSEMLLIGDRIDTDIEMAQRAGMPSILVETGVDRRDDLTDALSNVSSAATLREAAQLLGLSS